MGNLISIRHLRIALEDLLVVSVFFDLRDKDDDAINDILGKYYFLGPTWFKQYYADYSEWNLAYLILSPEHYEKLIPYEKVIEHYRSTGKWLQAIPHAEAWIPDHLPLEWICRVYLVLIREQIPAQGTHARALYEIERDMRKNIQTANKSIKRIKRNGSIKMP